MNTKFCRARELFVAFSVFVAISPERIAWPCPFCPDASQTVSEEIDIMDVVVIASLYQLPKTSSTKSNLDDEIPKGKFKVEKVIKGRSLLNGKRIIETILFGEAKKGETFLIMGVDPPKLMWTTPVALTQRGCEYIARLPALPKQGADRLAFFQHYLEDEDDMLARDAFDEFAKSPYSDVKNLKDRMLHDQLVAWINAADVQASRRRLYFTMLGVCGSDRDLPMLEEFFKSNDRRKKAGLDAMIACYLTLRGTAGMQLIEELFLKNTKADYADTYAAILAIRFHGNDTDVIPLSRLKASLRHVLERPQLADLVVPDLAKWKDWSVVDKLVKLFEQADEQSSWVRVPVINYLRACPLPEAKDLIKDLERIDPKAVERARSLSPYGATDNKSEKSS